MAERILLIDDDDDFRDSLRMLLESSGHSVVAAQNGADALDWMDNSTDHPCVILLDLMMPVMDGWTFAVELEGRPDCDRAPIVILSGVSDLQGSSRTIDAVGVLSKPVDLDELFDLVKTHC